MKKQGTPRKLWQEIGLEYEPIKVSGFIDESGQAQQHRIDNESEMSQVLSGTNDLLMRGNQSMESEDSQKNNFERQKLDSSGAIFQQSKKEISFKGIEVEEYDAIEMVEEYSHIENIIDYANDFSQVEANNQAYSQYQQNQEYHPSATSLLCSNNNIKHDKVSLPQQKQRLNILRLSVGELKREMKGFKQFIEHFVRIFSRQQEILMGQVGGKYQELEKQYSLKMQELVFSKRQQYEQLRYEYDVIKVKEQATRYPVKSQYFLPEATVSQIQVVQREAKEQEIEQLRQKMIQLEDQREALRKEVGSFKDKIVGIEANTQSIKDSNDKLYEYIFDLEQQCAFHKQEILLVAQKTRQQANDNLMNQLHQLEEDKEALISKEELLKEEVGKLKNQLKDVSTQKDKIQEECESYKQEIRKLKLQIQEVRLQLCAKNEELIKSQSIRGQMQGTTSLQNNIEDESPFSSRGKSSAQMERNLQMQMSKRAIQSKDKEWKQQIQQLQVQKAILERQNVQLKTTVQLPNQNSQKQWLSQQSPHITTYSIDNHYLSERYENAPPPDTSSDKYLKMKEKELEQYQRYLYSEAMKLQEKQKQIETDYLATRVRERSQRRNNYQLDPSEDNYGMKTKTLLNSKTYFPSIQQRSNHFFSSEAQAIIEKVKRSQRNNNSCTSNCDNSCRCEQLSRGSRTSRDSDNRNSYGFQSFKPYTSPSKDYYQRGQKSSKMKLIEEKVKRLKSQLKNSLTTMKQ